MKIAFIILNLVVIVTLSCAYPQQAKIQENPPPVKVKNWGLKSFSTNEEFWTTTQDEIIGKIGKDKFDVIKKFSANENIPMALSLYDPVKDQKVNYDEYKKRMSSLRVYRVVDFSRDYNGKIFKYSILSVPFQKLYWDSASKWDTVYFIIRSEAIEQS